MRKNKEEVERIEKEIEDGQETIYHELGHILGYRLAFKDNKTSLGQINDILISWEKAKVRPKEYRYHGSALNDKENISDPINFTAWIIEALLGCILEVTFLKTDIKNCWACDKHGRQDKENVKIATGKSEESALLSFKEFKWEALKQELIDFVTNNTIIERMMPIAEKIKVDLKESIGNPNHDFIVHYHGEELRKLILEVDIIIDEDMVKDYMKIVEKYAGDIRVIGN